MNFPDVYKTIFNLDIAKVEGETPILEETNRKIWLQHPYTQALLATLETLSNGYKDYCVETSSNFEQQKERIKESLSKVNILVGIIKYVEDGDLKGLTKNINYIKE